MRKSFAATIFAALLLALGTGAALAGNGHDGGHDGGYSRDSGSSHDNGSSHDSGSSHENGSSHDNGYSDESSSSHDNGSSRDAGPSEQSQPQQSQPQQSQPQQSQPEQQARSHESKHAERSSDHGDRSSKRSSDRGVKPSSTTSHDTHARADSHETKLYGNGKTAGEIARSRGASGDTKLHGPGNSQPHKVVACGKRHEVDVHAVKSYSASCGERSKPKHEVAGASHEQKHVQKHEQRHEQKHETCARTITVTVPAGVWHDSGSHWVRSGSKHAGDLVVSKSTARTIVVSDACKRSDSDVRQVAFQRAVPKCGHRVESVVHVQEQKPAAVPPAPVEKKVYICHATGSATNPYVLIHVSKHAEWAHTHHQDGRDVVLGETLTAGCPSAPPAPAAVAPAQQTKTETCTTEQQVQVVVRVKHFIGPKGSGRFVIIHPNEHSAHFDDKHPDEILYETRTITVPTACPTAQQAPPAAAQQQPTQTTTVVQTETVVPPTQTVTLTTAATSAVAETTATQTTPAPAAPAPASPAATTPAQGGVLGAQASIAPKAKPSSGGVLGTTGRIASSRLPFTGIALWIFVLVAGGLVAAGLTLRRSGRGTL
jgi:hypothetical protein